MKNEKLLVEAIVATLDEQFGERSAVARSLAADIASGARDAGNGAMGRLFESVADHYRYD